jgi:hypothetical protein
VSRFISATWESRNGFDGLARAIGLFGNGGFQEAGSLYPNSPGRNGCTVFAEESRMKKYIGLSVAALLSCTAWAGAQSSGGFPISVVSFQPPALEAQDKAAPQTPAAPIPVPKADQPAYLPPTSSAAPAVFAPEIQNSRFWCTAECLIFWERSGPVPPLVTTNSNATTAIGALNEPGTSVIFGAPAGNLSFDAVAGMRATVGGWFSDQFGGELSGFFLGRNSINFAAASTGGSAPIVSIPFNATVPFNLNPAGETSLNAGGVPNVVSANATSELWSAEVNGLMQLRSGPNYHLGLVGGFRFIELDEGLSLSDIFTDSTTGGALSTIDAFHTRNEFYGAQLGITGGAAYEYMTVEVTAKIAFGADCESSSIAGTTAVTNGAFGLATGPTAGGVFAQPSNIGQHSRTAFAVAPEVDVKFGCDVTNHVRVTLGYDFLYVSDVLRPGAQMDRNINPTQSVIFGGTGGVLTGPSAPPGTPNSSDFWAQGLTFGVSLRY